MRKHNIFKQNKKNITVSEQSAASVIGTSQSSVSRWRENEDKWRKLSEDLRRHRYNNFRSDILYPRTLSEKTEDELNKFIIEANLHAVALNKDIITKKAIEIALKNGEQVSNLSWNWILGFMERYNLSERAASTHIPQIIPKEITSDLIDFWGFIFCALKHSMIPLSRIGNCDETSIHFGYESKKLL